MTAVKKLSQEICVQKHLKVTKILQIFLQKFLNFDPGLITIFSKFHTKVILQDWFLIMITKVD